MKARKASRLRMESIEVRGFQERMSMAAQVAIALVVCHYQNDAGAAAFERNSTLNHRNQA